MAHELEIKNGEAQMFSVREVPWHGLGKILTEAPTVEQGIKLAGLDWKVVSKPIYREINGKMKKIENQQALERDDNNTVLSVMKDSYTPLQNVDAFKFFNPFIESGAASLETAGSLKDGKVVWVMANLNKAPIDLGGGDVVLKRLLLSNGHDGMMATRVGFTGTRVVCNNTLEGAFASKDSKLIRLHHTKTIADRLIDVQQIVNAYDAKFEATAEQYKALAKKRVNKKDLEKYINIVFNLNPTGDERAILRTKKMQETITGLFENGAGAKLKSANGTMWGAYNAVTEYLTHMAGQNSETAAQSRLYNNWFGTKEINKKAYEYAMKAV